MGRIVTRTTPVGELVPTCGGDVNYPAVEVRLRTDDGDEVLLGVIEYSKVDDTLNWLAWPSLDDSDADPKRISVGKADILRQLKARKGEETCEK